ncbi:MAG TPA: indolepyruvate oxidoreductase, partial [Bacteroidales bacterium]|nr:indolepyruvate oxidoreductase [Bacteroidales bacterium]
MKKDIILAGVGGQGILSIATTIGLAALKKN